MTGPQKATILDIARAAGVSKSTVSLVLQGSDLIRPDTAGKVRKAIEDVGYVYNRGAANLRKAHSNVIGMVVNDLTNPFYAELAVGMERAFQSAGIVPFIANTAENPVRQEEVLKSMLEQGVAGLIVSPARGTRPDAFRRVEAAGVPVVFAMRRLPESRIPVIAPDNHRGAWLAARHLVGKGHRRLAFFGGSPDLVVYHEPTARAAWPASTWRWRRKNRRRPRSASTTRSPSAPCSACAATAWSRAVISPSSASTTWSRRSTTCRA
jgi:LacI family transcriptional regulator